MKTLFTLVFLLLLYSGADAATRWADPAGSGSTCSSGSPCSLATAISGAVPGDTIMLKNGTYSPIYPNCNSGVSNGTQANPITMKAENERQAIIAGSSGVDGFGLYFCNWWIVEGLVVKSSDGGSSGGFSGFIWVGTNNIYRRNIFANPNRNANAHVLEVFGGTGNLLEENELYCFHRHGILLHGDTTGNVVRRNYVNGRDCEVGAFGDGSAGISIYPGSSNIIENNIVENVSISFSDSNGIGTLTDNRFIGNIIIGGVGHTNKQSVTLEARAFMPIDTVIRDMVHIDATVQSFSAKNTQLINNSFFMSNRQAVLVDDSPEGIGDGLYSISSVNTYIAGASVGFQNDVSIGTITSASFNFTGSYNNTTLSSGFAGGTVTNTQSTVSDEFGQCRVFVPDSASTFKGTGLAGADIGASILYASINEVLQDGQSGHGLMKLWNTVDGSWIHKGVSVNITGLNTTTDSIQDIEDRLHPGCTGADWPAAYIGGGGTAPTGTVVAGAASVPAGQPISATADIDANATVLDWVGMYLVGAPGIDFIDWYYMSGTKIAPGAPVTTATQINFVSPLAVGAYEFRLYCCDSSAPADLMDDDQFSVVPGGSTVIRVGAATALRLGTGATFTLGTQ